MEDQIFRRRIGVQAIGIPWYTRENYDRCLAMFADAQKLPRTFDDWLVRAEEAEKERTDQGMLVLRAVIEPEEFARWCADHGYAHIDTKARADFASWVAANHVKLRSDERTNP